jgi:hypothetical protein
VREFFSRPTVRFLAGFVFACFFFMPVVMVVVGPPDSLWFLAAFVIVGIAGGVWWVRRPPPIFFKPPAGVLEHGTGVFSRPTARFLGGFISGGLGVTAIMWVIRGPPSSPSFLLPTAAVGIVCGLMWARRSAALFW